MTSVNWVLVLAFWLHTLATVIWIGGLVTLVWLILPAAQGTLDLKTYAVFLDKLDRRMQAVGWFSLAVLGVTGMFQMSANPHYDGFMAITNTWAAAILIKHIAIGVMLLVSAYLTWGITPALSRAALRRAQGLKTGAPQEEERLRNRQAWILRINLALSFLVLALTALARVT